VSKEWGPVQAEIEINKTTYSFGGLAQSFYDSKELIEEFSK
jgi:hypothetical protein